MRCKSQGSGEKGDKALLCRRKGESGRARGDARSLVGLMVSAVSEPDYHRSFLAIHGSTILAIFGRDIAGCRKCRE